mgnify:CR=1 FL=1
MAASGFFRGRDEARIGRNVEKTGGAPCVVCISEFSLTPRFLFTVRHLGFRCLARMVQYLVGQIQPECFMLFHVLDKAA